jgi:hypothetical protein
MVGRPFPQHSGFPHLTSPLPGQGPRIRDTHQEGRTAPHPEPALRPPAALWPVSSSVKWGHICPES